MVTYLFESKFSFEHFYGSWNRLQYFHIYLRAYSF